MYTILCLNVLFAQSDYFQTTINCIKLVTNCLILIFTLYILANLMTNKYLMVIIDSNVSEIWRQ